MSKKSKKKKSNISVIYRTLLHQTVFTFYCDSCILKIQRNYHMKENTSDALSQGSLLYCERVKQIDFSYKENKNGLNM